MFTAPALIAAAIALPIGLTTAIYLSEYAAPRVRGIAKPILELLAGIPTVVYGFFAITIVTPFLASVIPGVDNNTNMLSGGIVVGIRDPSNAGVISQRIDAQFRNSLAETLTETEKAFQLGFVSMSEAILVALQAVSSIIVVIIMAVMANTMAMTARERLAEYATLKALGFGPAFVVRLLFGESLLIAVIGKPFFVNSKKFFLLRS